MKNQHQNNDLSIYQREIAHPREGLNLMKKQRETTSQKTAEKTYFPDLLTPYQRALLRQDTEAIKKMEAEMENNKKEKNNHLINPVILCYIAGILTAASLNGYGVYDTGANKNACLQQTIQKTLMEGKINQR